MIRAKAEGAGAAHSKKIEEAEPSAWTLTGKTHETWRVRCSDRRCKAPVKRRRVRSSLEEKSAAKWQGHALSEGRREWDWSGIGAKVEVHLAQGPIGPGMCEGHRHLLP